MDALRERRTHVRGPERHDMPHALDPFGTLVGGLVAGAAADEPAHRVADQRELVDLDRPGREELTKQFGERMAVLGDMTARVVADKDRRTAEVARQAGAVAVPARTTAPPPRDLGAHQAVNEDDDARSRRWKRRRERVGV